MSQILKKEAYENKRKSKLITYILWFFLGTFGVHRFYLKRYFSGFIILGLTIGSVVLDVILGSNRGNGLFLITIIWLIIDLFLIPSMVRTHNVDLALNLGLENI